MRASGFAVLPEFTLATGRRADIIGIGEAGEIWIVEIKSSPGDFRADLKWPEYRDYCDRLFFAIPTSMDPDMMPARCRPDRGGQLGGGHPAPCGGREPPCRAAQGGDAGLRAGRGLAAARAL